MTGAWLLLAVTVLLVPARIGAVPGRRRGPVPERTLPLVLDLTAAGLRSGRPLADAVALAARAADEELARQLLQVAALARLGADPEGAWSSLPRDGPLGDLARLAVRSAHSGMRLAIGLERLAADQRAARAAAATVRAHRAAVLAMAPLGACFLPSFVCLGIVPVVAGIARGVSGVVPGLGSP